MADTISDFGKKINQLLRAAYADFEKGYPGFPQKLTTIQKETILKEDFYNCLKAVPQEYLLHRTFKNEINNATGLQDADRIYFMQVISGAYRRLGLGM